MHNGCSYNHLHISTSLIFNRTKNKTYIFLLNIAVGCVAPLTRNVSFVELITIKGPRCFLEQETLPLLLSTGWFQERIWAWVHNRTKINWGAYGRLTCQISRYDQILRRNKKIKTNLKCLRHRWQRSLSNYIF